MAWVGGTKRVHVMHGWLSTARVRIPSVCVLRSRAQRQGCVVHPLGFTLKLRFTLIMGILKGSVRPPVVPWALSRCAVVSAVCTPSTKYIYRFFTGTVENGDTMDHDMV